MNRLTHINESGKAKMVDISDKPESLRIARAEGYIRLNPLTINLIHENNMKKGDVLTVAEVAGIMGGKKTHELIPLCHPIGISEIKVLAIVEKNGIRVESEAKCTGKTGIEMEALTSVGIALLTIWDMCKAVDKDMKIENIRLIEKNKKQIK